MWRCVSSSVYPLRSLLGFLSKTQRWCCLCRHVWEGNEICLVSKFILVFCLCCHHGFLAGFIPTVFQRICVWFGWAFVYEYNYRYSLQAHLIDWPLVRLSSCTRLNQSENIRHWPIGRNDSKPVVICFLRLWSSFNCFIDHLTIISLPRILFRFEH